MSPKVSIIIPVFNNCEFVKIMIDSIIAQNYQYWELLLVDDGSIDSTINMLLKYEKYDSRIKLIYRNRLPKGAQTCRNIGLSNAVGEYIIFFDSDDYVSPSCLSTRIEFMEKHPNLDFCVFPGEEFFKTPGDGKTQFGISTKNKDDLYLFLLPSLPFVVWNNIYRAKYLRTNNLVWDENIKSLQDSDYNIQNILTGAVYDYAKTMPDYFYRRNNPNSITKKIHTSSMIKSHLYFYEKIIKTVRKKYGNKYDRVLKYRSLLFLKIIISSNNNDNVFFVNQLKSLLLNLSNGKLLIKNISIYTCLCKYNIFKKLPLYIFFPTYIVFKLQNKFEIKSLK